MVDVDNENLLAWFEVQADRIISESLAMRGVLSDKTPAIVTAMRVVDDCLQADPFPSERFLAALEILKVAKGLPSNVSL